MRAKTRPAKASARRETVDVLVMENAASALPLDPSQRQGHVQQILFAEHAGTNAPCRGR